MAETPLVFEIATFAVLAVFFVVDLFIIGRKPHVPSTKECVQHIAFFVVMALIFGGLMWFFAGSKPAIEFYSGWLEYILLLLHQKHFLAHRLLTDHLIILHRIVLM